MIKKIVLYILLILNGFAFAGEWDVKKDAQNIVKFISSTPVLDFEGVTNNIDGYIYWEGDGLPGDKNELYFEVDLNTLSTGIGKRDRDMREDVLETDKWPKAFFKGKIYLVDKPDSTETYLVKAKGKMFIHGKEKEMDIPTTIKIENGTVNVQSHFSVFLKDYDIEAPSLLAFIKVAQEIKISLNFYMEQIKENNN